MIGAEHTRRRVLVALMLGGPALAACTPSPPAPPLPDPLAPVAARAEADVVLAEMVAADHPDLAAAATAIAADREQHAVALRNELRRARPGPSSSASPRPSAAAVTPAPDVAAARASLLDALGDAREQVAALVGHAPGHRAALLASIAACCASHEAVLP